ncbi:CPBP family intramembrane glutamic endopeptidase [Pseudonocardia parietis]|uniref:Membrane protease YdiL (CAAX protease family) n=1 Tax=Pseudonocardia parietis TaxID=570936 RepID=A0ABS4VXM5_9PSEU|nr:type II CAAX endopeptidase family protein [Pseudonocardia parietis]MBP2368684.1 membrane protease YdiL (CAAX protease family) [Pseudonocardia parietis]
MATEPGGGRAAAGTGPGGPAGGTTPGGAVPPTPPPGTGRPGRPSVGWTELLVAVPIYLVLTAAAGFTLILVAGMDALETAAVPLLALTGVATLLTAFAVLALRVRWLPAIGLRRTTLRWLLIGAAAGLVTRVLAFGVGWTYQQITGDLSNPQAFLGNALAGDDPLMLAGILLTGALLVPFAEELLFRGIGYGALRRYGVWVAAPASAAIFALAHGVNIILVIAFVLGVVCALLYERSRSVWPAVLTHVVFNASGFLIATLFL